MTQNNYQEQLDQIWTILNRTAQIQQETKLMFQETKAMFQETDKKFQETDKKFQKTDKKFKETDKKLQEAFQETSTKINQLSGLFGGQWGKLIEALVSSDAERIFQERGIAITGKGQRQKRKRNGETMEIDVILSNGDVVVAIEAKSLLSSDDVNDFLKRLEKFSLFFPEYKNYHLYGAVAALDIPDNVGKQAYRKGLFVIGVTGEGLTEIKNDMAFKPKDFANH